MQILHLLLSKVFANGFMPFIVLGGICGFILIQVSDYIRKKSYHIPEGTAAAPGQPGTARRLCLVLDIVGWVLVILSFVLLWSGGYYEGFFRLLRG